MRIVFFPLSVAGGPGADPSRGVLSRAVPRELAARVGRAGGVDAAFVPFAHMVEGKRAFGVYERRVDPDELEALLAGREPVDLVVHGDLVPGDPFALTMAILRAPDLESAGEETFSAPRREGYRAIEAAVRWLATRIELPSAPPADRPALEFEAFLKLLAAREEAASLDGWGEPDAPRAALSAFLAAIDADPDMEAAKLEFGLFAMSAVAKGLLAPEAADEALAKLSERFPDHGETLAARAQVRAVAGDVTGAVPFFERAAALLPDRVSLRFDLGVALLRAGREVEGVRRLEGVRADPRVGPAALLELGRLREAAGDLDGAITMWTQAAGQNPDLPDLFAALGRAHAARGEPDPAEQAFRRGIEAKIPSPALRRDFGLFLGSRDRWPEAEEQFRELLALVTEDPLARLHLGLARTKAGDFTLARHHLRKALRAGGAVAAEAREALVDLGSPEREADLVRVLDEAVARPIEEQLPFLKGIVRAEPSFVEARVRLGIALVAKGRRWAAVRQMKRALKAAPEDPEALSGLATALRARGKLSEAEEAHRRALRVAPHHAPYHLNLADTLIRLGRAREAAREVDVARALAPRHPLLPNFAAAVRIALSH